MGYFDGITDGLFKEDSSGNILFYPWGFIGSGYIINSEDKINQIRVFLKKTYLIMIAAIIIIQMVVGLWLNLALIPIYYGWYYFNFKKITKGLGKSEEKLKVSESLEKSAKSLNLPILILLELGSLGFVIIGVWLLLNGKSSASTNASIVFFGLCAAAYGLMISSKIRGQKLNL